MRAFCNLNNLNALRRLIITSPPTRPNQFWIRSLTSNGNVDNPIIVEKNFKSTAITTEKNSSAGVLKAACGDVSGDDDLDDEDEEEMYTDAHETLGHAMKEWGGPTRGGKLGEPTRFGVSSIICFSFGQGSHHIHLLTSLFY